MDEPRIRAGLTPRIEQLDHPSHDTLAQDSSLVPIFSKSATAALDCR